MSTSVRGFHWQPDSCSPEENNSSCIRTVPSPQKKKKNRGRRTESAGFGGFVVILFLSLSLSLCFSTSYTLFCSFCCVSGHTLLPRQLWSQSYWITKMGPKVFFMKWHRRPYRWVVSLFKKVTDLVRFCSGFGGSTVDKKSQEQQELPSTQGG